MDNVIALGTFDGIHRGHRRLIDMTCGIAREQGMQPLIYTFSNHPLEAFHKTPGLLMSHQARIAMLGSFCPVVTVPFSREYAAMEPADFVGMLLETYHMGAAVGGFNYTFGNHGAGNMETLRRLGQELGFGVYEIPPELYGNAPISSTRIRKCLEKGQVEDAAAMLGRHYRLEGCLQLGHADSNMLFHPAPALAIPTAGAYGAWLVPESGRACPCAVEILDGKQPIRLYLSQREQLPVPVLGVDFVLALDRPDPWQAAALLNGDFPPRC